MVIAVLFPGQGSQTVGMGRSLFDASPAAREVFEEVDDSLGDSLSKTIFEGPESDLNLTANTQPALMAVSMALMRTLKKEANLDLTQKARFFAGHSLGELSAHAAAGTLSLKDTAQITRYRGEAMQKAVRVGQGAMAAILGLNFNVVEEITQAASIGTGLCALANDNCPGQVVISGHKGAVEKAIELSTKKGAKRAIFLPVSAPFHCDLMAPAAKALQEKLPNFSFKTPSLPIVTNVTAKPEKDPKVLRDLLITQVTGRVRWRESVEEMLSQGVTTFIEVGAGKVLSGLVRRINRDAKVMAVNTPEDVEKIVAEL
ncbi:MAG: ACP S-malonyltransferase [bacterium]|nr:ACP S-malonyltransferase [bacterium]